MTMVTTEHQQEISSCKLNPLASSTANRRCQNCNEAIASDTPEAFVRWLHHQYAPLKLPSARTYYFSTLHGVI